MAPEQVKRLAPVVDCVRQTLTPTSAETDEAWLTVARRRLAELHNGVVVAVTAAWPASLDLLYPR